MLPPTPHGPLVDFGRFITKHASVMFTVVASAGLFLSLAVGGYANYWARRPKARDDVRFKTSFGFIGGSATPLDRSPAGSVVTTTLAHAGAGHGSGGGTVMPPPAPQSGGKQRQGTEATAPEQQEQHLSDSRISSFWKQVP